MGNTSDLYNAYVKDPANTTVIAMALPKSSGAFKEVSARCNNVRS